MKDVSSDPVRLRAPCGLRRLEFAIARPLGRAHFFDQRTPILVGSIAIVIQLSSPAHRKAPLAPNRDTASDCRSVCRPSSDLIFEERGSRQHETGLGLRHVDVASEAALALTAERDIKRNAPK